MKKKYNLYLHQYRCGSISTVGTHWTNFTQFHFFFNYPHRSNQATKYSTDTDYQISLIFLNADFKKPTIFNDVMGYHNKNQHEIMLINQHRFS